MGFFDSPMATGALLGAANAIQKNIDSKADEAKQNRMRAQEYKLRTEAAAAELRMKKEAQDAANRQEADELLKYATESKDSLDPDTYEQTLALANLTRALGKQTASELVEKMQSGKLKRQTAQKLDALEEFNDAVRWGETTLTLQDRANPVKVRDYLQQTVRGLPAEYRRHISMQDYDRGIKDLTFTPEKGSAKQEELAARMFPDKGGFGFVAPEEKQAVIGGLIQEEEGAKIQAQSVRDQASIRFVDLSRGVPTKNIRKHEIELRKILEKDPIVSRIDPKAKADLLKSALDQAKDDNKSEEDRLKEQEKIDRTAAKDLEKEAAKAMPGEVAGKFALTLTALDRVDNTLMPELFPSGQLDKVALLEARTGATPRGKRIASAMSQLRAAILRPETGATAPAPEMVDIARRIEPSLFGSDTDSAMLQPPGAVDQLQRFTAAVDPTGKYRDLADLAVAKSGAPRKRPQQAVPQSNPNVAQPQAPQSERQRALAEKYLK